MSGIIFQIATAFKFGGIWMWAILAVQIVSLAIIGERIYVLFLRRQPDQKKLLKVFEDDIKRGRMEQVINKARSFSSTDPLATVAQAGAQAAMDLGGRDEIQLKIDEVLLEEKTRVEKRTGFLAMLGNVATLVGLLGTIVGMIEAFTAISNANAVERAQVLSEGISLAMYATAYGLITAVPALIMYSVLQNRANVLGEDLNKAALKLFIWLGFNYEPVSHKAKPLNA